MSIPTSESTLSIIICRPLYFLVCSPFAIPNLLFTNELGSSESKYTIPKTKPMDRSCQISFIKGPCQKLNINTQKPLKRGSNINPRKVLFFPNAAVDKGMYKKESHFFFTKIIWQVLAKTMGIMKKKRCVDQLFNWNSF